MADWDWESALFDSVRTGPDQNDRVALNFVPVALM